MTIHTATHGMGTSVGNGLDPDGVNSSLAFFGLESALKKARPPWCLAAMYKYATGAGAGALDPRVGLPFPFVFRRSGHLQGSALAWKVNAPKQFVNAYHTHNRHTKDIFLHHLGGYATDLENMWREGPQGASKNWPIWKQPTSYGMSRFPIRDRFEIRLGPADWIRRILAPYFLTSGMPGHARYTLLYERQLTLMQRRKISG